MLKNQITSSENLFLFDCSVNFCGEPFHQKIKAETYSKARYRFYKSNFDEESYSKMFKFIKVKKTGKCNPDDLDEIDEHVLEQFNKVKEYRGISFAEIGMKIKVGDNVGKIVGANSSCNLNVDFNGVVQNCHPHWKTTYYDKDNNVIKEF
jgi:hypothetical protein